MTKFVRLNLLNIPEVFRAKWHKHLHDTFQANELQGHPHLLSVIISDQLTERIPGYWLSPQDETFTIYKRDAFSRVIEKVVHFKEGTPLTYTIKCRYCWRAKDDHYYDGILNTYQCMFGGVISVICSYEPIIMVYSKFKYQIIKLKSEKL